MIEVASGPKGRKIIWNYSLEDYFKLLKRMFYADTFLSYTYFTIPFTVHTDASDKKLGSVISNNDKPIAFLSRRLSKPQHNYTTT